ncbi:ABC transporter permease subunit [Roseibium sp. SCP14]|uniref:ABC transporter permease subunit n=1 Tax=Roseibium sp. SCP14 TaxID=3141375 RepID=UPI0033352CE3
MVSILKQKAYRDATNQVLFVGAIALTVLTFTMVGRENLEAQGITSGFGFLERSTGWSISFSLIEYSTSDPYWKALWVGFLNTAFLGAVSLCLATVLGLIVGIMRVSGNAMVELVGASFVEIFRNVPLLLQVFFWYALLTALPPPRSGIDVLGVIFLSGRGTYLPGLNVTGEVVFLAVVALMAALAGVLWLKSSRRFARRSARDKKRLTRGLLAGWLLLAIVLFWIGRIPDTPLLNLPYLKGLNYRDGIRVPPELLACIVGISIYGAAYIGEIIRAGFNAIGKGQTEAGLALGLTTWQIFTRIRLPLAIRAVLPTLTNKYVWLFKSTTIGIAVGFADFFMIVSTSINQSGQTLELIAILMGGFLLVNYSLAWVLNRVNDAIKLKGNQLRM